MSDTDKESSTNWDKVLQWAQVVIIPCTLFIGGQLLSMNNQLADLRGELKRIDAADAIKDQQHIKDYDEAKALAKEVEKRVDEKLDRLENRLQKQIDESKRWRTSDNSVFRK